jgi:hypothetical protein
MKFPFKYLAAGYFRNPTKVNSIGEKHRCEIVHGDQVIAEYDKWIRENFDLIPKKTVDTVPPTN